MGVLIALAEESYGKFIWQVAHTNYDPVVVASFYLDAISDCAGCPKRIPSDCGSENVIIARIQCFSMMI